MSQKNLTIAFTLLFTMMMNLSSYSSALNEENGVETEPVHIYKSRYFVGHSAMPLGKGNKYFHNVGSLGSVTFGLTENVSITAGVEAISTVLAIVSPSSDAYAVVFVNPKVGYQVGPKLYIGAGLNLMNGYQSVHGTAYGVMTLGTAKANISAKYGISRTHRFKEPDLLQGVPKFSAAGLNVSGLLSLSDRFSLVTDLFFTESYDMGMNVSMLGSRFEMKRGALDVGIGAAGLSEVIEGKKESYGGIPFPFLGYTLAF